MLSDHESEASDAASCGIAKANDVALSAVLFSLSDVFYLLINRRLERA